jgi:SARP family transcriptional regulator, regulator of embCAB operon
MVFDISKGRTMHIEVLGPLSVSEAGVSVVPSAGKPRQLLALLAIRNGRAVSFATLVEELWGDKIPRSATTTLQTYVLQIRRQISKALASDSADSGRSSKDVLSTSFGGYQLEASPYSFDLREFERLTLRGDTALDAGDALSASAAFGEALSLWRGPALQDVPTGRVLSMELLGMEEARMRALDQRITADLRLGRHAALVPELRMLTAQHPLHEKLHARLMLALHRAGSTWRALETFQQLRQTLVTELGVEPSQRIQRLHQAILSNDPALESLSGTAERIDDHGIFAER